MPRSMGQTTSLNQSLKEQPLRRPFANLSFLSNSFNARNDDLDESIVDNEKPQNEFLPNDCSDASDYVKFYRQLYLNPKLNFLIPQLSIQTCKWLLEECESIKHPKRRELEDVIEERKMAASEKFFADYKKSGQKESGDFLVLEFFKVMLPLVVGSFEMFFNAFVCTVDEKAKKIYYDELGSFFCLANGKPSKQSVQTVVREIFLRRPPFKTTNTDIYLLVHCYGNVVKREKSDLINCVEGVGISRIGKWTLEENSLLSAKIDYSNKSVYIEESQRYEMDLGVLANWKPDFGTFQRLRDTLLNKRSRDLSSFLSMELSNENGIGDFDQSDELDQSNNNTKSSKSSKPPKVQKTIDKYVFFVSPKQASNIQLKEDSVDHSSGYGSMPSSSAASTERGSVELEKELNFSVDSNACVICSSRFNTIAELMLHLEFRYPSLKFSYDPSLESQINVKIPDIPTTKKLPPITDYLLLNRSLIKQYRSKILSNLLGRKIREPTPVEVQEDYRPPPLELKKCPLPFNPPVYQEVTFPGMYGVETPQCWLEIFQNRKLNEFVDVSADEKEMMKLWNRFINHRKNRSVTKTTCNLLVKNFAKEHGKEIMTNKRLGIRQFLPHVTILFKKGLVDTAVIEESLKILLNIADGKSTFKIRSSPRKEENKKSEISPLKQKKSPGRPKKRHRSSISEKPKLKKPKLDEKLIRNKRRVQKSLRSLSSRHKNRRVTN